MKAVFRPNVALKVLRSGEWTFSSDPPEVGAVVPQDGLHLYARLPNGFLVWLDSSIFKWRWDGRTLDVTPEILHRPGSGQANGEWCGVVKGGVWIETGEAALVQ